MSELPRAVLTSADLRTIIAILKQAAQSSEFTLYQRQDAYRLAERLEAQMLSR